MPTSLVSVANKPPLDYAYFPNRFMGAIFRGWGYIPEEKLADVLQTTVENVRACAEKMGLDPELKADPVWRKRGYVTIVRNMWHMLSYDQICTVLDLTQSEFDIVLKEDDFLFTKLGVISPRCEDALYRELTKEEEEKARKIKETVERYENELGDFPEKPFDFVKKYYEKDSAPITVSDIDGDLRLIYSYFALYGDPLIEDDCDPFPDRLLREYAEYGINGLWMQGVLYQLTPYPFAPELSKGYEKRLENLRKIVKKAKKYGIGIYLYINEPRNMSEEFFEKHPHLKGHTRNPETKRYSLCTSTPEVQEYLENALYTLFHEVEDLGGILTITASENQTNCYSHATEDNCNCPRCKDRKAYEVISEVNNTIARGVHRASPKARVIAWDWAWPREQIGDIIERLDKSIIFQKTSESEMEIVKGGISNRIQDYSISNPGPSELSKTCWKKAQEEGLECSAKVQFNCSWEMSALPFIPAFDLVAEHARNLKNEGIKHIMLSWTLGGSPSPNIRLVNDVFEKGWSVEDFVRSMYGASEWETVMRAQREFSKGFREFPFHIGVLYDAPQNSGPKSQFFTEKTGWNATMVCYPYDDLKTWRVNYPEDVFENQFRLVCEGNKLALDIMESYKGDKSERFVETYNCMKGCYVHFLTTYNLIRFTRRRNEKEIPTAEDIEFFNEVFNSEEENVKETVKLLCADSRLGFEATNHYSFTRRDLFEKLININWCRNYYKNRR